MMSLSLWEITFASLEEAKKKATWGPEKDLVIEGGGLCFKGRAHEGVDLFVLSEAVAIGTSWRPCTSVSLSADVFPVPDEFTNLSGQKTTLHPGQFCVRFSPDLKHWSSWQALEQITSPPKGSKGTVFSGLVQVPHREKAEYWKRLEEYAKLDVPWASDEEAAVKWILKKDPSFFEARVPFIGYIQFLFEAPLHGGQHLKGISIRISWGMSGLHNAPKDPKAWEDRNGPWRFISK